MSCWLFHWLHSIETYQKHWYFYTVRLHVLLGLYNSIASLFRSNEQFTNIIKVVLRLLSLREQAKRTLCVCTWAFFRSALGLGKTYHLKFEELRISVNTTFINSNNYVLRNFTKKLKGVIFYAIDCTTINFHLTNSKLWNSDSVYLTKSFGAR